ncbi:uncharacterized protein LOC124921186 [Impatiens glandulifera]|uniref:uncharacterized protein LOC124921186 n=1 Tax=Impatiens glandulifera TaxID=253017 RepID=UPI001FB129F5|nr:uncharacterized protein LOC124921186 [Impatiens glandulifera]
MEDIFHGFIHLVNKPTIIETFVDILLCAVPIWLAVMIGLLIGWSWRPRWTGLVYLGFRSKLRFVWTAPPGFGARRLWLAFTALSAFSVARTLWSRFNKKEMMDSLTPLTVGSGAVSPTANSSSSSLASFEGTDDDSKIYSEISSIEDAVTSKDVEHLMHLLDGKDGETAWQSIMKHSTSNLAYQAWRHESETGPIIYRSRTVFEDATPEMVRDFFWDDEFRPKWDPMLAYFKILEECPRTGAMIVHWIKKFPFFCSDREYIIARRLWESERTYYCVSKGVPYLPLQKCNKPRRVDLYFSGWVIKSVPSRKGEGQLSACEVSLVHYEDMGIPKDVAKLGVRHGMWGTVKKMHASFRSYQNLRKPGAPLSRYAVLASIGTNIASQGESTFFSSAQTSIIGQATEERGGHEQQQKRDGGDGGGGGIDWRWAVAGGTVALFCGLKMGVLGKALMIGAGQRIARNK